MKLSPIELATLRRALEAASQWHTDLIESLSRGGPKEMEQIRKIVKDIDTFAKLDRKLARELRRAFGGFAAAGREGGGEGKA